MNLPHQLFSISLGAIALVSYPLITLALERQEIVSLGEEITVLVDGQFPGSGVLIGRRDRTYYVLTAKHVVETEDEYEIVTVDQERHLLDYSKVIKLPNVDLALIVFNSDHDYQVAQLAKKEPGILMEVYTCGFPDPGREITERVFQITSGSITGISESRDGYSLVYSNNTRSGMSGGPILDRYGQLIGIHGRAEAEQVYSSTEEISALNDVTTGFNLGIPISTFVKLAEQAGIDLPESETPKIVETPPSRPPITYSPGTVPSRPTVIKTSEPTANPVCAGRQC